MGIGGISIWQLLIVLAIVILLFGTKKLRNVGGDLGSAIKNFRKSVKDPNAKSDEDEPKDPSQLEGEDGKTTEGRVFDQDHAADKRHDSQKK